MSVNGMFDRQPHILSVFSGSMKLTCDTEILQDFIFANRQLFCSLRDLIFSIIKGCCSCCMPNCQVKQYAEMENTVICDL